MTTKLSNQPFLAIAGLAIVTLSEVASAQSSSPVSSSSASSTAKVIQNAAATQLISTTSVAQMAAISVSIAGRSSGVSAPPGFRADAGQRIGMAAGGASDKFNAWASVAGDKTYYNGSDGKSHFNADATSAMVGMDYAVSPMINIGVSAAMDGANGGSETFSTLGLSNGAQTYQNSGYTIAPYLGLQISKELALDASIGTGKSDLTASTGATATADRSFYGLNLTYTHWQGNMQLSGKAGYLHGQEKYGDVAGFAGTGSTNKLGQFRIGGQAALWMDGTMPYFGLAYLSESRSTGVQANQPADDLGKKAWVWSVGVNFISVKNSLTGGISYNSETGRSNGKHNTLMANVNVRF